MDELKIVGRSSALFKVDFENNLTVIKDKLSDARVLVIGGAGSIGKSVVNELFQLVPKCLHVVDISENNLVELVRNIRSSIGYNSCEFKTFCLDFGSKEFEYFCQELGPYEYIFNLSALKHVRSEEDKFTMMRMVNVNVLYNVKLLRLMSNWNVKKYFCVSTDKAANPVNVMGASKRIMEQVLFDETTKLPVSLARFANVAFSDGSLLHGFRQRMMNSQPLSAPCDVERYFITSRESGLLCVLSGMLGDNRDIYFPNATDEVRLTKFSDIAIRFLNEFGFEPYFCDSENEARSRVAELRKINKWPLYLFESDTTGEKPYEEFYTKEEVLDLNYYHEIGVIKNEVRVSKNETHNLISFLENSYAETSWEKSDIIRHMQKSIPEFHHIDTGLFLSKRM